MANEAQVIFYFESGPWGWSEVWHKQDVVGSLKSFNNGAALTLGLKRVAMLANESKLVAIKTSKLADKGDSWLSYFDQKGPDAQHSDSPHTSLYTVFASSAGNKKKSVFLRGIPDDIALNGGIFQPVVEPFRTNAQAWANAITQGNWGWMTTVNGPPKTIGGYVQTVEERVRLTLPAATFAAPGDEPVFIRARVNFKGNSSRLNGVQVFQVNSTTTCTTVKKQAVFPFTTDGKFVQQTFEFVAAADFGFQKIGRRPAGRPSHLTRGREQAAPLG